MKSPNKHTSLSRLKQIKQDNYVGETGQEYVDGEVDYMIMEKTDKQAREEMRNLDRIEQAEALDLQARIERANRIMAAKNEPKVQKVEMVWSKERLEFYPARFVVNWN